MSLQEQYAIRLQQVLIPLAKSVESHLSEHLAGNARVDRISARPKSLLRFFEKANKLENGVVKYSDPIGQVQDQIGARIVTFYTSDIARVSAVVEKYYRAVESRNLVPESEWEFGYFGRHYVLFIPRELIDPNWSKELVPQFFELQIKTLFQHAWSEANHDLGYKPSLRELTTDEVRKLAFTAAQAWGADQIFNDLFAEITESSNR